jgi:hypothetical protein
MAAQGCAKPPCRRRLQAAQASAEHRLEDDQRHAGDVEQRQTKEVARGKGTLRTDCWPVYGVPATVSEACVVETILEATIARADRAPD